MDSKGVRGENDEKKIGKEEGAEYIQEEKIIRIMLMTQTWIIVVASN